MKETSVAGESPDKSDKKQSSGETARSERDPRLSAFRREPDEPAKKQEAGAGEDARPQDDPEAAAGTKSAAKPGAKPKAETDAKSGAKSKPETDAKPEAKSKAAVKPGAAAGAKAVEPSEAEAAGPSEVSEEGKASEGAEASQGAAEGDGGGEGGDDRLRAAVAAWVASTDGDGAEGGDGGSEGDAAGAEESGPAAAGADADEAAEAAEGAAAKPEAKSKAKGAARPDVKAGGKADAKTDGKAAAKAEPAAEAGGKAAAKAEPAAKAAGKGAAKAEAVSEGEGEAEAEPASASLPQQAKAVDQPTAVFKTVGPQKGKPSGAAGAAGEGKGDGKGAGDGDGGESDADEAPGDDATRVFAIAKLKGKGAESEVVDQATTAFKINPPAKSKDGAKGKPGSGSKADAKDKADAKADAKDTSDSDGKTDATKDGEGKTDAKTDGDAKKDAGGKAKGAPERDSERTSQFVALKSADDGTAGKSLGKTAPRTPARTPDKAADKPWDKAADTAADKSSDKSAGKDAGSTADEVAEKPAQKPAPKSSEKPAAKAPGALPAAEPAKPATPPKQAGRTGAAPSAAEATGAAAPAALPESERTKQEPLPPLDLLAQLTNTPPPPETPLRTVVRRFKIWTPLAVLLAIVFVVAQAVRPLPAPKLTVGASTAFTFKGGKLAMPWPDQGQAAAEVVGVGSLGTSGKEKPVPTASVAKVMTAYVLLRDHPLKKGQKGQTITVDAQGEADSNKGDESRVPLKKDQKFTQYQMMQMLMIPSGNNVARQLARWDAGSEAAFVKKMNDAAKKLGMKKTHYTDPSGLLQTTVSTSVDQLKLAEQVVKNDVFREVVRTENAQIPGLPERIYNNNSLLTTMAGKVSGIKTGSSTPAGGTFMWSGYRTVGGKDQLLLGVTMDQHTNSPDPNAQLGVVLRNTEKVITAARDALVSDTVVKKGQVVGYVDDGLGGETPVVATKDLSAIGWSGMKATFSMSDGGKSIPHTAKAGTEVGVLTVGNGESTQKVPVALQKDLVEPTFGSKLVRIT
ncbi:serine hydrolase [Streptomyces sioyaensis]|uniref:serine hydrolase n=1 Tax=Streptomyces sioyaensis TaxID=67364 RepID=UPI0033F63C7B